MYNKTLKLRHSFSIETQFDFKHYLFPLILLYLIFNLKDHPQSTDNDSQMKVWLTFGPSRKTEYDLKKLESNETCSSNYSVIFS